MGRGVFIFFRDREKGEPRPTAGRGFRRTTASDSYAPRRSAETTARRERGGGSRRWGHAVKERRESEVRNGEILGIPLT